MDKDLQELVVVKDTLRSAQSLRNRPHRRELFPISMVPRLEAAPKWQTAASPRRL